MLFRSISLEEAAAGITANLRIPRLETCEICKGSGAAEGTQPETCATCGGTGQVRYQQGFFSVARTCGSCRGAGRIIKSPCETCQGAGRVERERSMEVKIPAGTQTGTVFRVKGQGMPVLGGRGRGDLFVSVTVVTPTTLTRDQRKLLEQLSEIETTDLEDKGLMDKVRDIFG